MNKVGHHPFPHAHDKKRNAAVSRTTVSHRPKYKIWKKRSTSKEKWKLNNTYHLRAIIETKKNNLE